VIKTKRFIICLGLVERCKELDPRWFIQMELAYFVKGGCDHFIVSNTSSQFKNSSGNNPVLANLLITSSNSLSDGYFALAHSKNFSRLFMILLLKLRRILTRLNMKVKHILIIFVSIVVICPLEELLML
jgi:hypothetical protein